MGKKNILEDLDFIRNKIKSLGNNNLSEIINDNNVQIIFYKYLRTNDFNNFIEIKNNYDSLNAEQLIQSKNFIITLFDKSILNINKIINNTTSIS